MGTPSHNAPKRGPPGLCAARHRRSREQRWGRRRRRRLRLEPLEPRVLLSGHPLITEFMAANDTTLLDVDGDRPDWVELHNPTAATVSLDGWHLTDDASHLSKWPFPAVTVEPGDYLVVFASEKDRRDPAGELHTNFALKSDGEYLALVDPGGTPVSEYAWPYPSQRADVSYGLAPLEAETLVMSHAPASALVPTDDSLGLTWTQADFDDSGWAHGTTGVGYDRRSGYEHLLGLDLGGAMYDVTTTAYVRVPFTVADPAAIDVLTLRMKYDDGFVAYLNGTEVARRNAPGTLGYDAAAPQGHADAAAVVFEDIDLSGHLGLLEPGGNVLAIHALNVGTTSSDLLILPELVAGDTDVDPAARRFFVVPTPGSANAEGYLGLAADPAFDHERGFYGSGFDLHLTSDTDGATIRYTTDGATPSATAGDVYQSPIPIDTTTVVRAVAVKDGFVASGVETHTYLFAADVATQGNSPAGYPSEWKNDSGWLPADYEMDPEIAQAAAYADVLDDALLAIPTISLVTDVEHLFDPHTGIYMNPRESGVAWERPVSAELLHPDGTAGFQIDAGLRIQGGASRLPSKSPKHSFRLLFKGIHGPTKLEYPLFGDDAAAEFDTITLRAGFNQSWIHHNTVMGDQRGRAQYVRDQWAKDTQLAMGGLAPHNDYAHLYVNGLYWGLYNPTERPDAAFAAAYLGGDKADYDALNSGEPVDGNRERWNQLFDLVNAGVQTEAQYQAVAQRLDIDSFIDYMVLNHYAGNRDWDHHNWYAFARRDTAGKFYFASWDAESIFIGSGDDRTGLDHDRCPSRLLNRLAENAEFRVRFADRVHAHFHNDGALTPENVVARWSTRADQVYEAVVAESARWGDYRRDVHPLGTPRDLYERDVHWAAERDRLLTDYFPGRTDTVLQQYRDRGLYPVLDAPAFSQHGGSIGPGFELAIANPNAAGTVYYTLDGSDPREAGGAVSLGARMYTGEAVELAVTTRVRARVFDGAQWSALTEAAFRSDAPDALISEFMADNDGTLADEDGEFTDWIEVHNPTAIPVSLADWLLTDDPAREDVWQFPAVTLGPGDYLVVFASGKDRAVAGAELHTDFRLNDGGEYLALVEPDGSVACAFAPEYARQTSDVSYGLATDRVSRTVMAPGAPVRTLVPSDGSLGLAWTEAGYDDSGWEAGTTAVGYEADTGYEALLGAEVAMRHVNPSAYARIPFYVADPSDLLSLSLRIKYDDGFVAYLNGHEAAARLAPATPQWDSTSTGQRQDAQCLVYEEIDLSDDVGFLTVGRNVLALHGLNANVTSSDLLLLPEMVATTAVVDPGLHRYFAAPTPGLPNVAGGAALGPVIAEVSHSPAVPQDGEDIVVTAAVRPAFEPLGAVTLRFRVGFGSETALVMTDDGTGADAQAGDGLYTAAIPSGASGPGEMVRWRVTAADAAGGSSRRPLFPDPLDSPEYFGTVVADPSIVSNLPVLHWFVADPAAADTRGGTRCSVFYDGEFYDNVRVDLHGQSTAGFPKKSYDFDFNADDRFRYADGERRVKDFNLLTNWADKAKVRNTMAYEVYRSAGAPYHVAFPVRVHQNGAFFSVADWVEDGDDRYLDRLGLDPDGALYKVYNDLATASRAEKKTRKDEGNADLQALVDGLHLTGEARTQFLFDHVNIPEVVNFLAATVVTANRDLGHKNYYVYRDTEGTGLWHVLPWDVDLSFGRNWTREEHYYDDTMYWDNSVFVGAHNQLFGALYQTPAVREMFLRRVRTLMDQLLQPPGTPPEALRLEQRVADLVALIDPHDDDPHQGSDDADLDYQAWGSWGNGNAMRPAAARITDEFLPARRHFLYHDQSVAHGGEIPDPQPDLGAWPPGYQHVTFGTMAFNPTSGEQEEEYVEIVNHNGFAVDASGWELRGAVELTLPPGTVLPAGGTLYASPDVNAFRARATGPSGGQGLFVVGDYRGHLSAFGETLWLDDAEGRTIASLTYAGDPSPQQQFLRITEIMYHPAPPEAAGPLSGFAELDDFEFIELQNVGSLAVDLAGARFVDGIDFVFPSHELGPGERAVIISDLSAFLTRYGTAGGTLMGEYGGSLSNAGEGLRFEDASGGVIHEIDYRDGWHPRTDGEGFSLVVVDAQGDRELWEEAAGWRASGLTGGSPGAADPGLAPGSVVINEVLTHTDEAAGDWTELRNATGQAIDVGGWYLSDDPDELTKYEIASDAVLGPGEYLILTQRDHFGNAANAGCHEPFGLSELGESLHLTAADDGVLLGYQESVRFGAAPPETTFGRTVTSTGQADFVLLSTSTPGNANAVPLVGPVVIDEIMYHPAGQAEEFIELLSISTEAVPLYDPVHPENTWRLDGAIEYTFPASVTLAPGARLLVVGADPEAFRAAHGLDPGVPVFGPFDGALDNDGESIKLYRPGEPEPDGTVPWIRVDRVKYDDRAPWPERPDGEGPALSRLAPTDYGNDPAHWAASTLGGTPGRANAFAVIHGGEVRLATESLVNGTLSPQAPAARSLGIEGVEEAGNPEAAVYAVKIGPDPDAGWLRFVDGTRAQADASEPQWHPAEAWEGRRVVGLTPATAYDFYAKAINEPGPVSDWAVVGSLATTSEGDVDGSGPVTAIDYAHVRAAILRGGEPGDTVPWACDLDDDGSVTASDLATARSGILNPPAPPAGQQQAAMAAAASATSLPLPIPSSGERGSRRHLLDRDGDGDVDRDDIIAGQDDYTDLPG